MKTLSILGGISAHKFFRDYWHKKPLLIRQAFTAFAAPLSRDELFALAARDDVESRIVSHESGQWSLQTGPFQKLPAVRKKQWTLLVQGVNLHDERADSLLKEFRFVPDARLDDLMISYATDGGGVGPHFDSYDVFLLQAEGRRRWRISSQTDLSLDESKPLKILKHFSTEEEFLLEPGDMLYLPPHYAHDGVAEGECMTYSIGFRSPSYQEIGEAFLEFMACSIDLPGRYADPDLAPTKKPAEIDLRMLSKIKAELEKIQTTDEDVLVFLGEYLSEPKPTVFFESPDQTFTPKQFSLAIRKKGASLSRKTRMLYRGKYIFINGESVVASNVDKTILASLADGRNIAGQVLEDASTDLIETLHVWYEDGWISLG